MAEHLTGNRSDDDSKITLSHLDRKALVYVRQSTASQVLNNVESTSRQYGLAERAMGPPESSPEGDDRTA